MSDVRRINNIDTNEIQTLVRELTVEYNENELYETKTNAVLHTGIEQFKNNIGIYSLFIIVAPVAVVIFPFAIGYNLINDILISQ